MTVFNIGLEQNRNRNFVQESKFLFSSEDYRKYWHSCYKCQEETGRIYILPVYLFRKFKVKVKVKGCSSSFLPDSCNQNAGISGSLQTETRISIPAQRFGSGSAKPLVRCRHTAARDSTHIQIHTDPNKGRVKVRRKDAALLFFL